MLIEIITHVHPKTGLRVTVCVTEDGEFFEFTSDDVFQELARLRWISKALEAPFIIDQDQE